MQKIGLAPVDGVTITTILDNAVDMLLPDQGPAKRAVSGAASRKRVAAAFLEGGDTGDSLHAEHGFSVLVSVRKGEQERKLLFDAGVTPDGVIENMARLELSLKDVEAIVLSHGHYDHTTGLDGIVRALGRPNLPVIIHPEFWSKRRIAMPGREPFEIPSTSKAALLGAGFEVIEERQPSFLLGESVLITGEVDRSTEFEKGFPVHQALRDGHWQPDPLILDDQALVVNVRDKGLVVLTGCGHAGIVNITRYVRKLTGVDTIYAIIGGFHLNGPLFAPIIPDTCRALAEMAPQVIVPAHCTGWQAVHALIAQFPDAFIPNSVGTRFEL
ncbi:MAG TPA: MBL fold metallo-hydrolase [Dehalococcoidia bacterium]|nr:MBL fold metallo-hydrolase [Dehalococcoidia bacterium]